jgi:hypothetical protein
VSVSLPGADTEIYSHNWQLAIGNRQSAIF